MLQRTTLTDQLILYEDHNGYGVRRQSINLFNSRPEKRSEEMCLQLLGLLNDVVLRYQSFVMWFGANHRCDEFSQTYVRNAHGCSIEDAIIRV